MEKVLSVWSMTLPQGDPMTVNKKKPNPIDIHVGSRIRLRRTMLGMSQERLGESLGITFQQIQKYEKGTNRVGASRLQNISSILNVPVSFFFEDAPGEVQGEQPGMAEAAGPNYVVDFLSSSEGPTAESRLRAHRRPEGPPQADRTRQGPGCGRDRRLISPSSYWAPDAGLKCHSRQRGRHSWACPEHLRAHPHCRDAVMVGTSRP
jgi:transcriptional regulator with XRE-family HTH domain